MGGMESSKMSKGRNASKKIGNHWHRRTRYAKNLGEMLSWLHLCVALSTNFIMRNAVIWFMEAKHVAGKFKPLEETGLTLSGEYFVVSTCIDNVGDSQRGNASTVTDQCDFVYCATDTLFSLRLESKSCFVRELNATNLNE